MRNVLFLCTHNSARSILAEALLNHLDSRAPTRRFQAWSAGSSPRPGQQPHPLALEVLQRAGISTEGLHSKNWDEFAAPGAPHMDLIITVCDSAAGEVCPIWPGIHKISQAAGKIFFAKSQGRFNESSGNQ